jgi:hypothetical protein
MIPGHDEIFRLAAMAPDDCCRSARRFTFRRCLVLVAKVESRITQILFRIRILGYFLSDNALRISFLARQYK